MKLEAKQRLLADDSVRTLSLAYRQHLLKTLPRILQWKRNVLKDPEKMAAEAEYKKAIEKGYEFLKAQPSSADWQLKVRKAGEIVQRHINDLELRRTLH